MARTWQVILATIVIFVAGLVTGGATALGVVRWAGHHRGVNPGAFGPGFQRQGQMMAFGPMLMRRFESRLNLTDDQKAKIMPIVKRTAADLGRDLHEVQLRAAAAIEKMQDEISGYLTPEQRAKFDELVAEQRARFQQFRRNFQQGPAQGDPPAAPANPK